MNSITDCDLAYLLVQGGALFLIAWFLFWLVNAKGIKTMPLTVIMAALLGAWIIQADKLNPCRGAPRSLSFASRIEWRCQSMTDKKKKPMKIPLKPPPPLPPEPPQPQPGA